MKIGTFDENEGTLGALLRASATNGQGTQYVLACRWSGSVWQFSVERNTGITWGETVGTRDNCDKPAAGAWIGFAVTGTGDDTVFEFWEWPSDPGAFADWGTDNSGSGNQYLAETANPVTALDTGAYTGIWFYHGISPTDIKTVDEWYGGDQAAGGAVEDAVLEPAIGTACWGHDTTVVEDFTDDLSNWTGDATVSDSGDAEIITFTSGQEKISPIWNLGAGTAQITLNKYNSGDAVTTQYKTGATAILCEADSWHNFSVSFTSEGYVKIRLSVA